MKPADIGRLLSYALLGCIAFVGCWIGGIFLGDRILGDLFSLTTNPWSWVTTGLGLGSASWLGFVLSALLILSQGPVMGRMRFRSLAALAGWLSLLVLTFIAGVLWAMGRFRGVDLPTQWMTPIMLAIPVIWNLTWALDVTRRRRKALDAQAGMELPPPSR